MIEINIHKNLNDYDVVFIKADDGSFSISFAGNLDLYWTYHSNKPFLETKDENTITITKENYYLYSSFEALFEAIKNDTPNSNSLLDYDKNNKVPIYNSSRKIELLKEDTICWRSDDFVYDEASSVSIKKIEDEFKVTFKKSTNKEYFQTFSVRFRNSGSRYDPFNATFMHMYNKLREYDYQVCFEEVLYQEKKLLKEMETNRKFTK